MNKKPLFIGIVFVLLVLPIALAVKTETQIGGDTLGINIVYPKVAEYYKDTNVVLPFDILNSTYGRLDNTSTICEYHIINKTGQNIKMGQLTYNNTLNYWYTSLYPTDTAVEGYYNYYVHCSNSLENGFVSSYYEIQNKISSFELNSSFPIGIIILLPMLLGLILLFGAATLSEEHGVLRIFLFLMSILTFFISMGLGLITVAQYYTFDQLQESIGDIIYWLGLIFVVIITYFIIYLLYKMIRKSAEQKEEELRY